MTLDGPTILLTAALICLLLAGATLMLRHGFAEPVSGLGWWAAGSALLSAAYALLGLRDLIPDWASVVAGNTLLAAALGLCYHGLRLLRGRPGRLALALLPALAIFSIFSFMYRGPALVEAYYARVLLISLAMAVLAVASARIAATRPNVGMACQLTAGLYWSGALIALVRAASAAHAVLLAQLPPAGPLTVDLQVLPSVLAFLLVAMTPIASIGVLLMAAEHHRRDLQYRLEHDHLTGVSTRQAFERAAEDALRESGDDNRVHALLLADLDHFKRINDDHGHAIGDAALRAFVDQTRALLREQDLFGRYGGEEFVLLLPGVDAAGAAAVAERIRRATAALVLSAPAGTPVPLTVSLGLCTTAQLAPALGAEAQLEALLKEADDATYAAKAAGRNRVAMAGASAGYGARACVGVGALRAVPAGTAQAS
ncbi:GGDEF domain-containing protein [Thiohalocapsa halophila]|nr:GGDEF domain-containing protein [Thiohalocapsa halophila]